MNKIEALKATLVKLNDKSVQYDWYEHCSCNCGILAQSIMNIDDTELGDIREHTDTGTWHDSDFKNKCEVTGLHLDVVIRSMFGCGFNKKDIANLEHLDDDVVLKRLGWTKQLVAEEEMYVSKESVIAYITAWISILEEAEPKEVETVYITVKVDSKVKDLVSKEALKLDSIQN